jgi:hypothetical protein
MSWMAGLGQGLMGAGDTLSRYLVQRQVKNERSQDLAYRDRRASAEDADRAAARAIQQEQVSLSKKTHEDTVARLKRDEDRGIVRDVLGSLSIGGGRQSISPDIAAKAKEVGFGTFVQDSTPIGVPLLAAPALDAGPTASPMIPANVQAQIASNINRDEQATAKLAQQEQLAQLAHAARMAQIGATSQAAGDRNEISSLRAQLEAMGLQSANVQRAYTIARQRVEAMYADDLMATPQQKEQAIDDLAIKLLGVAPANFGDAAPVKLNLGAPPPPGASVTAPGQLAPRQLPTTTQPPPAANRLGLVR